MNKNLITPLDHFSLKRQCIVHIARVQASLMAEISDPTVEKILSEVGSTMRNFSSLHILQGDVCLRTFFLQTIGFAIHETAVFVEMRHFITLSS